MSPAPVPLAAPPVVALLDVGPTEFLLLAGLFFLLFGADKLPDLARGAGRILGQVRGAGREFQDQLARERGEAPESRPGDAVPPEMKAQMRAAEDAALARLRQAARALGIEPGAMSAEELRAAIADKVSKQP